MIFIINKNNINLQDNINNILLILLFSNTNNILKSK